MNFCFRDTGTDGLKRHLHSANLKFRGFALGPVDQFNERHTNIFRLTGTKTKTANLHDVVNAGHAVKTFIKINHRLVGTIQGCPRGKFKGDHQRSLVFVGNERGGDHLIQRIVSVKNDAEEDKSKKRASDKDSSAAKVNTSR